MNDLQGVKERPVQESHLMFGLSTMHAWIRFFECLVHLSYQLDIFKSQARTAEGKEHVQKRKQEVHTPFREKMHLHVD